MGCAVSKHNAGVDVVSLCKERKRLLKLAVERRYAFADAQATYNQSLYGVAMALSLFIARHSSTSSPFLITFPSGPSTNPNEALPSEPKFLHHTPSEPISKVFSCQGSDTNASLASHELKSQEQMTQEGKESESESESEDGGGICEHFYDDVGPKVPSLEKDFGWDFFFSHYDQGGVVFTNENLSQSLDGDLRAVREKEGIPELEEAGEGPMCESENMEVGNSDEKSCKEGSEEVICNRGEEASEKLGESNRLIDETTTGRELLDALKDIVDHFHKAYESGLAVSRMLEAHRVQLQSGLEEIKESSSKLIRSITRSRSTSLRSSSCKSLLTSSSVSSSTWSGSQNDLFDDYGMQAGSHSLTLGRLYAWEKKLYEEVKYGDRTRKLYEQKCSHLCNQDATGDGICSVDKCRSEVKDLHARLSVAIASVETISNRIQRLRDEELHPQLLELSHGLMRNWMIMLDSHETQRRVMLEVKSFNCSSYGNFCNDSHRLATVQLEAEIDNWNCCLIEFVSTQKAYIEALCGWLAKFIAPEVEFYSSSQPTVPDYANHGPPLLTTCHDWLACLDKLPNQAVTFAMKKLGKDIRALWSQQGEEQRQKRKVDGLAKEVIRRALAYEKEERRIIESEIAERGLGLNLQYHIAHLAERKSLLVMSKKRLDAEKGKHLTAVQETERVTVDRLQTGFSSVFESLAVFSRASMKMYADLVTYSSEAKGEDKNWNEEVVSISCSKPKGIIS